MFLKENYRSQRRKSPKEGKMGVAGTLWQRWIGSSLLLLVLILLLLLVILLLFIVVCVVFVVVTKTVAGVNLLKLHLLSTSADKQGLDL